MEPQIDLAIIRVSAQAVVANEGVKNVPKGWMQDAGIALEEWSLGGSSSAEHFIVGISSAGGLAARRTRTALRLRLESEAVHSSKCSTQTFCLETKNLKTVATEAATERLAKKLRNVAHE